VDPLVAGCWLRETRIGFWRLEFDADTVQSLAPWSARRAGHLALARILERSPQHGAQAAAHFESGGRPHEAGRLWLATARLRCLRQQHRAAAQCFADAVRLLPDDTPEAELVAAVRDIGVCAGLHRDMPRALALLETWRDRAGWLVMPVFQGYAGRILADLLGRQSRHVESAQTRRAAAQHFLQAGLAGDAAAELIAASGTLVWALRLAAARETATEAVIHARSCGRFDLESQALAAQGLAIGMLGETREGRANIEASLDIALTHRLTALAADAYRMLGNVTDYASCYDDQTDFRKAIAYCGRHDHTIAADLCRGCLSYALFRGGRWTESLRLARQVSEGSGGPDGSRAVGTIIHGMIRVMRGEMRSGIALVEKGRQLGLQTGIGTIENFAWTTLATANEMGQRAADAAVCYRRLMDYWMTTDDWHDVLSGFSAAVTFFCIQGDRARAAEFAAPLQRIAAGTSNREALGAAHYAAAELKLFDQEPGDAAEAFSQALAAYEEHHCSIESIRARIRLGSALTAAGKTSRAMVVLHEARARAVRLGCRHLAALANQAIPPATGDEGVGAGAGLSQRQREVAHHLSAGRTNKEIAAVLGISVRTVDMHVAHLFVRLDCRTRTEAAAKLAHLHAR
jgi:DNA-binding CsgD family transcriptional regulator/tetratricopeptide (TPR) repeat protein